MEYSIQQLSRLSGVTTRALRWYDKIGLLKPSRTAASGYRYYGPGEVDRLQDILYYRALGVELAHIREYLDSPSFDRVSALRSHLSALKQERSRLDGLIRSVEHTIAAQERNEIMNDSEKFEAFKRRAVEENDRAFGRESRSLYGDAAVDAARSAVLGLTEGQYRQWDELGREIQSRLEEAVSAGKSPLGAEGRGISRLHGQWLAVAAGPYDAARHRGIAELYVLDGRFTAYYDKNVPGCARFLRDAVCRWAGQD